MPKKQESVNREIYDFLTTLLRDKKVTPLEIAGGGSELVRVSPEESDVFKFEFDKDNTDYGDVRVAYDPDNRKLIIFYDDQIADSPDSNTSGTEFTDSWKGFRNNIKKWAMRKQIGFELSNKNHMGDYLQQRASIKKKSELQESYYPMGKMGSYNDSIPNVKIIIQHTRKIEEGEQRFRNVAKIYVENANGERFAVPTNRPGIAKVYARHIAEGGSPYDDRGRHITSLVEEYSKMSGFVRAVKNRQFNESTSKLVQEGINHYFSLRETLSKMTGSRGYNVYFESWQPILNEESDEQVNINELFVHETIDPRIESVLPILSKLHKKVNEMNEIRALGEWADTITETEFEEATDLKSIPEEDTIYENSDHDQLQFKESTGNIMTTENSELARIMYLVNPTSTGYKEYLGEDEDSEAPKNFVPTHFHKTNLGGKDPLMMTEPGVFWSKSGGNITRFVPKDWDPVASTKPGLVNRLSVDGEIVDGQYMEYPSGKTWKDGFKLNAVDAQDAQDVGSATKEPGPVEKASIGKANDDATGTDAAVAKNLAAGPGGYKGDTTVDIDKTLDIKKATGPGVGASVAGAAAAGAAAAKPSDAKPSDAKPSDAKPSTPANAEKLKKNQDRFRRLLDAVTEKLDGGMKSMSATSGKNKPGALAPAGQPSAAPSASAPAGQPSAAPSASAPAGQPPVQARPGGQPSASEKAGRFLQGVGTGLKQSYSDFMKGLTTEDVELEAMKRLVNHKR
jgi:hypothetical protein